MYYISSVFWDYFLVIWGQNRKKFSLFSAFWTIQPSSLGFGGKFCLPKAVSRAPYPENRLVASLRELVLMQLEQNRQYFDEFLSHFTSDTSIVESRHQKHCCLAWSDQHQVPVLQPTHQRQKFRLRHLPDGVLNLAQNLKWHPKATGKVSPVDREKQILA